MEEMIWVEGMIRTTGPAILVSYNNIRLMMTLRKALEQCVKREQTSLNAIFYLPVCKYTDS